MMDDVSRQELDLCLTGACHLRNHYKTKNCRASEYFTATFRLNIKFIGSRSFFGYFTMFVSSLRTSSELHGL